ncbi:glycogen debranching enzyme, glycoside hydrolase family 13 protein [Pseudohyphozyma bogoriensis]|nr:glycogen debranching enzyme, glycoside hydrolase family 13 protein [Pseudohyphozyma bogoriensis]
MVNRLASQVGTSKTPAVDAFVDIDPLDEVTVYSVTLEDDGSPAKDKSYLRLPPPFKPYILRITIDAGTAASKKGVLYTNFPLDGSDFVRSRYHTTNLPQDFSKPFAIDLPVTKAGAFEYFVEHEGTGPDSTSKRTKSRPGYFCVEPILSIPSRTPILAPDLSILPPGQGGNVTKDLINLPLDGLVVQSIIAKWMGTLDEWAPHLDLLRDRGYNMIHFTPLQQRGESGSPYSIFDQMEFDDELFPKGTSKADKNKLLGDWLAKVKKEWGLLGMMDIVLNHTANNSAWLEDHPEAGYNVVNSPHLEAAVELDTALIEFSASLASRGLPTELKTAADLDKIMDVFAKEVYPSLKLYEFYVLDVIGEINTFRAAWVSKVPVATTDYVELAMLPPAEVAKAFAKLCLPDGWSALGGRFGSHIDSTKAVSFVSALLGIAPNKENAEQATTELNKILNEVNLPQYKLYDLDHAAALENTKNRIRYTRLDDHGPKYGPITPQKPLVEALFTRLPKTAKTKVHDPRSLIVANNGWIWDADPLQDFASKDSRTYIRRDLIVWGDCVKLRYGKGPSDNPWLWSHMTKYVEHLAGMFEGFRIDNCHSTPIHVGETLLDAARRVNPNLYVCAELFSGSQELDLHFVCKLGLNSLIREAMNGNDPKDQSSLLYGYGLGKPIGSMDTDCLSERSTITLKGRSFSAKIVPHSGSVPHAFLMDCTHDNESPLSKRTAEDALPTGALVTFARAAVGSNRGFDDLYPHLLDLVNEKRHYEIPKSPNEGIGGIKRLLNHLHTELVLDDGVEGHFFQEGDYITSHRVNPVTHKGYLLVAHTAFHSGSKARGSVAPIRLDGTQVKFIAGATVDIKSTKYRDTDTLLRGLDAEVAPIKDVTATIKKDSAGPYTEIVVPDTFPPGSVLVFATWMDGLTASLDALCESDAKEAFSELDLIDLNPVLFRADGEERDALGGDGVYTVPGMGELKYCGLQGWMPALRHIMAHNDLGHPLCAHLREGAWALDYVHGRMEKQLNDFPRLAKPAAWLKERFDAIKADVPAFLRPKYFAMVINVAYKAARDRAIELCAPTIREGNDFVGALALTSVQMYGKVRSASLVPSEVVPSLAAGLPHFTAGWARTWGRDVFISLRGLFLVTGQFAAAREHILAFSSVLKHGLIPNLLDSGKTPRYNSRDSPWFMLQNIQDYVTMAPNGISLLKDTVKRRFPLDDEWVPFDDKKAYATTSSIADIIQEILQRHASGIHFREYNAGPNLDMQMSDAGFNIDIEVDWKTGIIYGGSAWNCGTWMDKMGESEKAGSKGWPGTPRDGAPVEIIGLLKSTLRWVAELSAKGEFPHKGVEATIDGKKKTVTYKEWGDLIQASFEKHYYVPEDASSDKDYVIDPKHVARRGIYKDVYGTGEGREKADYQLRANFPIAMTVAPELFTPEHALVALKAYDCHLVGPLGVKTLDPADSDYRGYYDNANDSDDFAVAKGRNYHQGPEWVWPIGYFLRAFLIFDTKVGKGKEDVRETYHHIYRILSRHRAFMASDPWAGLPELTNENGQECYDSCRTQAWSSSTILDVLDDISRRS